MKKRKKKPNMKKRKIPKSDEMVVLYASLFESTMDYGDRIGITNLAQEVELSNKSHPHVNTVEQEMRRWKTIQSILPCLKFIEDKKKGTIKEVWKQEPADLNFQKEIRNHVKNLQNQLDTRMQKIEDKLDRLLRKK